MQQASSAELRRFTNRIIIIIIIIIISLLT